MAATDQTYRRQRTLDIVFAVSSILMLLSLFWMLWDDYNREFKQVQRKFRDVEDEVFLRSMVAKMPDTEHIKAIETAHDMLADAKQKMDEERPKFANAIRKAHGEQEIADADAKGIKADYDSINSLINIEQDDADRSPDESVRKTHFERVKTLVGQRDKLKGQLDEANGRKVKAAEDVKKAEKGLLEAEQAKAREVADFMLTNPPGDTAKLMDYSAGEIKTLGDVEDNLRKTTGEFDRLAKTAASKKWKAGDWFRNLPLIDAFAAPTRIQQYTFNDLTIDYSFKQVTRYDRCTTCHLGIERGNFDKDALSRLKNMPEELSNRLAAAHELLKKREKLDEKLGYDPDDIPRKLNAINLKEGQVSQYCAHPRLDLFVDANSPHPAEKFGCSICHGGQGSATDFLHAAHVPDSAHQKEDWEKEHEWEHGEFWDYPMLAKRFTEASCLKCHHQVTDLVRYGSKEEAPKLMRGFNLIRENGCFGCHEISGQKSGRPVGPDMRLEANVLPLEALTPAERTVARSDPLNPPGTYRKVGPSLYHLAEKTNEEWVRKWLHGPRDFRPDTKMPHFFGLSTNNHDYLAKEGAGQENFPDAEIHAIAHYLISESKAYLEGKDHYRQDNLNRYHEYEARQKREAELRKQIQAGLEGDEKRTAESELLKTALTEKDKKELAEIKGHLQMAGRYALLPSVLDGQLTAEEAANRPDLIDTLPATLAKEITDGDGNNVAAKYAEYVKGRGDQKRVAHGNRLFREKGCLACHVHDAIKSGGQDEAGRALPAIANADADFGPNLSRIAAKLGTKAGDKASAHRWLVQWIVNPKVLHPRTRMPITHLGVEDASDVADWLLAQDAGWNEPDVDAPATETLKDLLEVNMTKLMPKSEVESLKKQGYTAEEISAMKWDADERILSTMSDDNLKWYLGKRAINRYGCFGCHNIPGFESAKPIGTPLNDWGKKDPERLAFENIEAYVEDHLAKNGGNLVPVDGFTQKDLEKIGPRQETYEQFFLDALKHHQRDGFLHQKLMAPRSYDYHRPLAYDDRLRMPQFRFARGASVKPIGDQTPEQAEARAESQAREAVMTFILGLLADPIPLQYLNRPTGDKLAEAKGRAVIDTFNCAGCHQVRAGVYEFKRREDSPANPDPLLEKLRGQARDLNYAEDYFFPDHNAWAGGSPIPGRIRMHGIGAPSGDNEMRVTLTQALHFEEAQPVERSIRAGEIVSELPASGPDVISASAPYGGYLADLLTPYLMGRGTNTWSNDYRARHGLPPTLIREGERVQPDWLFRFLRHPTIVRPPFSRDGAVEKGMMALRMPRFNMSEEDAQAIVNYFGAVDRLDNPSFGVNYPYITYPQRRDNYLKERNAHYVATLPKLKAEIEKTVLPAAEAKLKAAKTADEKATAEKERDALKKLLADIPAKEKSADAFAVDAYRLMTAGRAGACLQCHSVGKLEAKPSPYGPPLDIVYDRLRPDWMERWLANPKRLLPYQSFMPANYPHVATLGQEKDQDLYPGMPLAHVTALRDLLMIYPKAAALPEVRDFKPPQPAGGKQ